MVKESVKNSLWKSWFEIPWIEYGEEKNFNNEIQFDEYDKAKKNNLGLVQWAIQAHENGWGYVYGTYGNVLTESILQDRASVFGGEVIEAMNTLRGVTRTKLVGREWTHWLQIPYISYVEEKEKK